MYNKIPFGKPELVSNYSTQCERPGAHACIGWVTEFIMVSREIASASSESASVFVFPIDLSVVVRSPLIIIMCHHLRRMKLQSKSPFRLLSLSLSDRLLFVWSLHFLPPWPSTGLLSQFWGFKKKWGHFVCEWYLLVLCHTYSPKW